MRERFLLIGLIVAGCASIPARRSHARPALMVDGCECDELAKRFAQKGDIALAIDLDQTGEIQKVGIVRSPSQAASDAAVRLLSLEPVCRFIPAKDSQGNPIATRVDWVFRRVPMWCAKYPGLDAATAARVKPPEIDAARCGRGVWYPPEAIEKRVEGNVRLDIRVERDGRVSGVTVLEGLGHGLDEAAVDAIQSSGCRFTPAMTGEGPVPADLVYTFHFQLPR